ncbi:hypothetical protein E2C01_059677 [Portunus trituberculatus]|uniref:Uncharacterized protein n=1 Tax=Portunus trituberculatus TaxID=210409 RepID=A0A5B7GZZ6_PORTR|nr:hypothetical protein [Portunus trituberculatus]
MRRRAGRVAWSLAPLGCPDSGVLEDKLVCVRRTKHMPTPPLGASRILATSHTWHRPSGAQGRLPRGHADNS